MTNLREEFMSSPDGDGDWTVLILPYTEWGDSSGIHDWDLTSLPFLGKISECPQDILDRQFDSGYGSPERPVYTVWTDNYVILCTEYDGSTSFTWERRNPPTTLDTES